jgi:hypothetical protein
MNAKFIPKSANPKGSKPTCGSCKHFQPQPPEAQTKGYTGKCLEPSVDVPTSRLLFRCGGDSYLNKFDLTFKAEIITPGTPSGREPGARLEDGREFPMGWNQGKTYPVGTKGKARYYRAGSMALWEFTPDSLPLSPSDIKVGEVVEICFQDSELGYLKYKVEKVFNDRIEAHYDKYDRTPEPFFYEDGKWNMAGGFVYVRRAQ